MSERISCPECGTRLAPDFVRCPTCHAFVMDFSPWRSDRNLLALPLALFSWWGLDALLRLESLPTRHIFSDGISRTILALALYGLFVLWFKWRVSVQQTKAFRLVRELCARQGGRPDGRILELARQHLTAARVGPFNNALAYQRLQWLAGAMVAERHIRPGLLEALRQHEETDWDALDSSFATLNFLIWLLPTVGFLGTVWGMMDALKSFSDLLQTGSDMGFQAGLMQTAKGLGVAFHTTLVGLAMVIPLLYLTTMTRRRASFMLERLDKFFVRLSTHALYDLEGNGELSAVTTPVSAPPPPPPEPTAPPPLAPAEVTEAAEPVADTAIAAPAPHPAPPPSTTDAAPPAAEDEAPPAVAPQTAAAPAAPPAPEPPPPPPAATRPEASDGTPPPR